MFNTVQKMITAQKYKRNEKKHYFLLDGLIVCYECKHKIGVKCKKDGWYWMVCNNYRRNSKMKICTSHGFSYNKLEKDVLEYIRKLFQKIDSKKIELDIKSCLTKYDYSKMLERIETEIKLINDSIDKMYVDKLNGKVSEEMYNRVFEKMQNDVIQKEKEYTKLRDMKENDKQDDSEKIKKVVKEFLKLEKPTPEIMKVIINRIELHQDKKIDIIFNFRKLNKIENCTTKPSKSSQ